ncbi:hypothetical protein [Bradyrhizobium sp. dw_78]|uniref:hypothetical protein n=1 Tax=Bradyrhizobium sp. dw_78 TaxID=2719793 RepID=UPI001BD3A9CA|nr:hypothetical protein [Bradyrhizobium sp. dw_78]
MLTFETTDPKQVRRFRTAQFNGRAITVTHDGSAVTGFVRSVLEHRSSVPPSWSITIIPAEPRAATARPAPRPRAFADDLELY